MGALKPPLHASTLLQLRAEQQRKQLEVELEAANAEELERRVKAVTEGRG